MAKKPIVSSLSLHFKRSVGHVVDDVTEQRKRHREKLSSLMFDYMDRVSNGEAEGIRNAKDLVEIMKMDLLLMGEPTERVETKNDLDELKIQKLAQVLNEEDPRVQQIIDDIMMAMNRVNDEQ